MRRVNRMTKSYFWKYFRYKLLKRRGAIVFFALLNLVSTLLPAILYDASFRRIAQDVQLEKKGLIYGTPDGFLMLMFCAFSVNIIMIVVMTIKSFRIYYKRPDMDTLGCLPVSYKERFWGDFLSAVFLNLVSFVPMYIASLFFLKDMKGYANDILHSIYGLDLTIYPSMFSVVWMMLLLVYLGVYAAAAFVCSCCGKKGSAILYSIVMMGVLPGIFGVYANYMFSYIIGMDVYAELTRVISMLPPLGPVVSTFMVSGYDSNDLLDTRYYNLGENPFGLVVFLLITAIFIAGAYFIGKRRRAERVGEGFVFKSAYHVLTLTFMVLLIGASFVGYSNMLDDSGIQWVLLFTFIVYTALEVSQNKGFKGFWKTAVRYAAVFGVCIGFFAIVKGTNAFNLYKSLPSVGSIKEIRLSGRYFYTPNGYDYYKSNKEYTLDEKESFSEILNAHKDFLETGSYETGEEIRIIYVLKDGRDVTRLYSSNDSETEAKIKSISDNAKQLPDFDFGDLGVIDEPDLSIYTVAFIKSGTSRRYVRGDKLEKFAKILRYDIENNYCNAGIGQNTYGSLRFTEKNKENSSSNDYLIFPSYTGTIEFLNDPDNVTTEAETNKTDTYIFEYTNEYLSVCVIVSTEDTRAAAKELLSYIKPRGESDNQEYLKSVRVVSQSSGATYTIDPANEKAAIKAMIALFLEKH